MKRVRWFLAAALNGRGERGRRAGIELFASADSLHGRVSLRGLFDGHLALSNLHLVKCEALPAKRVPRTGIESCVHADRLRARALYRRVEVGARADRLQARVSFRSLYGHRALSNLDLVKYEALPAERLPLTGIESCVHADRLRARAFYRRVEVGPRAGIESWAHVDRPQARASFRSLFDGHRALLNLNLGKHESPRVARA